MTLGRTSSGKIKIKTDGGLRAVECACCGNTEFDLCRGLFISNPLLSIIQNATQVQVDYDLPAFGPDIYDPASNSWVCCVYPQIQGYKTYAWNGSVADTPIYEEDLYDGRISISLIGNFFSFLLIEVSGSNREIVTYTAPQECRPTSDDGYIAPQLFTIPVNGQSIPAFQFPLVQASWPPAFYPTPTISVTFS
jgi:hypothetical protein